MCCTSTRGEISPTLLDLEPELLMAHRLEVPFTATAHGKRKKKKHVQKARPKSNVKWRRVQSLPNKMLLPYVVPLQEDIYVGGGLGNSCNLSVSIFSYNATKDSWKMLPETPSALFGMCGFQNSLVIAGGVCETGVTGKVHRLNKERRRWEEFIPEMPTSRFSLSIFSTDSVIVACGGGRWNEGEEEIPLPCKAVEVYSSVSRTWSRATDLPRPCASMSSTTSGNICYLLGDVEPGEKQGPIYTDITSLIGTPAPADSKEPCLAGTPTPADSKKPSGTPAPADSKEPSGIPAPADSKEPSGIPAPADSKELSGTPAPADSKEPSGTPAPADSKEPSGTPAPADSKEPSGTPAPADSKEPSGTPAPADSKEPRVTVTSSKKRQTSKKHRSLEPADTLKLEWKHLPPPPVQNTSIVAIGKYLCAVGGNNRRGPRRMVHIYMKETGSWWQLARGDLPQGLESPGLAVLNTGEVMVVGGEDRAGDYIDSAFIGNLL